MKTTRFLALLCALIGFAFCQVGRAANIVWVSDTPNTNASGATVAWLPPIGGFPDDTFVTMLQAAGHNVVRFTSDDSQNTLLTAADITALNTNDVIIIGRATGSAAFQAGQGSQWNTNITKPIIVQSSFLVRQSRLGWMAAETSNNGNPMPLTISNPNDPTNAYLFGGGTLLIGSVTASNYDIAMEQNTSQTADAPAAGARILATGIASSNVIVEFKAGTAVKAGANILAGYRLYFASGNREASVLQTAGSNNLTTAGRTIFLRAVNLALANGVPPNLGQVPTITQQPPALTAACAGLPLTLTATADGQNPLLYQWYFSDGATFTNAIASGTNAVLSFSPLQTANAGYYALLVSNAVGSVTSSIAAISISGTGVVATVNSLTNCPGTTATFTAVATGSGTLLYAWRKGATIVQVSSAANVYSIPSVVPGDAGAYSVTVVGDCNTVSNNFNLTVVSAPTISAQPQNLTVPMGNGTVFSVTAANFVTAPNTYQWQTNGVNVTGATGTTLAISNLTLAANGMQVRVAITNCAGGLVSSAGTLTVTPISGISFDFNTPGQYTNAPYNQGVNNDWVNTALNNAQPFGPVVPFEVSTGGVGVATGSGALDLTFNNGTDQSSILLPVTYDFSLPGKTLTASIMVKIKVPTAIQRSIEIGFVSATQSTATAVGGLAGVANNGWMAAVFQSTNVGAAGGVTPSYQLLTQNKIIAGTAVTTLFSANSPSNTLATNNWYKLVAKFVNTKGAPGSLTDSNFTTELTVQDMGANGLTPGSIVLAMAPTLGTNVDIVNAPKLWLAIRGFENGGNDYWDNIYVTTANGPVAFVSQPASQTVLQGRVASFQALVDGSGPYTYQWFKNGSPIPGAGNWKYTTPQLLLSDNGAQYTVTVTSTNTITSAPAVVTVQADPLDVLSVGSVNGSEIGLRFDQPVTKALAETPGNYLINGTPAFAAQLRIYANLQQNRTNATEVLLTPASPISGAFTVTVANVTSLSGTVIGANNSATGLVAGLTGFDVDPFTQVANQFGTLPGEEHSFAPGQFEITGGGHDIFGNFDGFRFVYKQMTGDFDIKTRVPYMDIVRTPNKAGFNARISLEAYSPNAGVYTDPPLPGRNFVEGGIRPYWNVASSSWGNNTASVFPNTWVRFRRAGNMFMRYSSTNGVNWLFDGQVQTTNFPPTIYVGLAVNCNVGTGVMQQPALAQLDNYGDFGGYPGATIAIGTQPANQAVAAGAAATFTVVATASGGSIPTSAGELSYLWQRTNSSAGGWTNLLSAGATNNTASSGNVYGPDNGALYRVIVSAPGAVSVTSAVVTLTVTDTAAPTIVAGGSFIPTNSANTIVLTFSEFLSAATGLNPANYVVTNAAGVVFGVASVSFLNGDQRVVVITTSNSLPADYYGVRVTGVQDQNGNAVAANTVGLSRSYGQGPLYPVVIDYYGSLATAGNLTDLTTQVKYLNNTPDWIVYSNSFNVNGYAAAFPSSADFGDNYGVRMYSYFIPTNSTNYIFWWRADDFAQFSMNTNALDSTSVTGKVSAFIMGVNNPNYQLTNTFITPVLNAGQPYYLELIFKEGGGGDGGVVMVTTGNTTNGLTPPAATAVAPGELFAFPTNATPLPKAIVELYTGIPNWATANGSKFDLQYATNSPAWVSRAFNRVLYERYFGYATNLGNTSLDGYGGRIYSYFVAPTNGNYRFWIRADDAGVFYMNTNAANSTDPAGKVQLGQQDAFNATYTSAGQNISLVGGQRYYIEGVWREGGGGDGMTIAVRSQGDGATPPGTEVIQGSMLEFPTNLALIGPLTLFPLAPTNAVRNEGDIINFVGTVKSGANPYTYLWYRNGVQVFANVGVYTTPPLTFADNGAVFSVVVTNLFSAATQSITLTVNQDSTPPSIVTAVASQYGDTVLVTFSERLNPLSAGSIANYRIPGLQILSVDFDEESGRRVSLRTSRQPLNTVYTLTVNGVRDASLAGNMAVNASKNFSSWGFGGVGGVLVEIFTNIPTTLVQAAFNDPRYVDNIPSFSFYTNTFSGGLFGSQGGFENYLIRISGLFMPPSNGLYRFYCRGDDETRIYMNTNGPDPSGRTLIALNNNANSGVVPPFTAPVQGGNAIGGDSSRAGASISPILSLTNGTPYYLEAFMKEGGGGDYITVIMRAIDSATLTEVGGLPGTAAAVDSVAGGFFSAPGNPDVIQLTIVSSPPTEVFATENQIIDLSVVASVLPPSMLPFLGYQWARSNANSGVFTNIPGAIGSSLSPFIPFAVPRADNNAAYRVIVSAPGTTFKFETLLHVTPDTNTPFLVSASSLDGKTVGIRFNEPVDIGTGGEAGNYNVTDLANGNVINVDSAIVRATIDPATVLLVLNSPLTGAGFQVDALDVLDTAVAPGPNRGNSTIKGTVQNLIPFDIGGPALVGNSFSSTNGEIDVTAGGAGMGGASDQGHLTLGSRSGNFDIWARVQSLTPKTPPNSPDRAGLMVRETTNADSKMLFIAVNPPTSVGGRDIGEATQRATTNSVPTAWSASTNFTPAGIPNGWLRLKRANNTFTAFRSSNGVDWVVYANTTVAISNSVYLGLGTTPNNNAAPTTVAKYRNIHIPNPPAITVQPTPPSRTVGIHTLVSYSVTGTNPPNSGPLGYQWRRNSTFIPGATNATLTLTSANVADSGVYAVDVFNDGGGASSSSVSLLVTNAPAFATNDSLVATQAIARTVSTTVLTANDFDPEGDPLAVIAVSGRIPRIFFSANFDDGLVPPGTAVYANPGTPVGTAIVDITGGVNNSGVLKLTPAAGNSLGSFIITNDLAAGQPVSNFTAQFKILVTSGSGNPADGFSFSFASDLPNGPITGGEEGGGTGLIVAFDNYDNGGGEAPAVDVKWAGTTLTNGHTIISKIASANFLDVLINLDPDGTIDVSLGGITIYSNLPTPYVPITGGKFGLSARTGGEFETHWVDDLTITDLTPFTGAGGRVSLAGGTVTYTPANCGPDAFYYVATDGQIDSRIIGRVNVSIVETNPAAPSIITCATNRTILLSGTNQTALPDMRGELVVTDNCGTPVITQIPAAGTTIGVSNSIVRLIATDPGGLSATCTVQVAVQNFTPAFNSSSLKFTGGTFSGTFPTTSGHFYSVQYTDTLPPAPAQPVWTQLGSPYVGDGTVKSFSDSGPFPNPRRFYRLVIQ